MLLVPRAHSAGAITRVSLQLLIPHLATVTSAVSADCHEGRNICKAHAARAGPVQDSSTWAYGAHPLHIALTQRRPPERFEPTLLL